MELFEFAFQLQKNVLYFFNFSRFFYEMTIASVRFTQFTKKFV